MSERKIVSGENPKKHAASKQTNPKTAEPITLPAQTRHKSDSSFAKR